MLNEVSRIKEGLVHATFATNVSPKFAPKLRSEIRSPNFFVLSWAPGFRMHRSFPEISADFSQVRVTEGLKLSDQIPNQISQVHASAELGKP